MRVRRRVGVCSTGRSRNEVSSNSDNICWMSRSFRSVDVNELRREDEADVEEATEARRIVSGAVVRGALIKADASIAYWEEELACRLRYLRNSTGWT